MKNAFVRNAIYTALILTAWWLAASGCRADRLLQSPGGGDDPVPPSPPPLAPYDPQALRQFRSDGVTPIGQGETITEDNIVIAAVVDDPETDDSLRLQLELRVSGAAFTGAPTHTSDRVARGERATIPVNGVAADTSFRWRVRAVDRVGRASTWVSFGDADVDFRVSLPRIPAVPVDLTQLRDDRRTIIPVGATVSDRDIWLRARVNDPDRSGELRLDVEVRRVEDALIGQPTHHRDDARHGETVDVKMRASAFETYRWQARLCDRDVCSEWVPFGGNPQAAGDFTRNPFADDDDVIGGTAWPRD